MIGQAQRLHTTSRGELCVTTTILRTIHCETLDNAKKRSHSTCLERNKIFSQRAYKSIGWPTTCKLTRCSSAIAFGGLLTELHLLMGLLADCTVVVAKYLSTCLNEASCLAGNSQISSGNGFVPAFQSGGTTPRRIRLHTASVLDVGAMEFNMCVVAST